MSAEPSASYVNVRLVVVVVVVSQGCNFVVGDSDMPTSLLSNIVVVLPHSGIYDNFFHQQLPTNLLTAMNDTYRAAGCCLYDDCNYYYYYYYSSRCDNFATLCVCYNVVIQAGWKNGEKIQFMWMIMMMIVGYRLPSTYSRKAQTKNDIAFLQTIGTLFVNNVGHEMPYDEMNDGTYSSKQHVKLAANNANNNCMVPSRHCALAIRNDKR
jgi:hypothetical protein